MAVKNETALVEKIRKAIAKEYPEAWTMKVHGGKFQMTGVPDLLVCASGLLFGFEVKHQKPGESEARARGRATEGQLHQIDLIQRAGGFATVILTPEEALEHMRRELASLQPPW